MNIPSEHFQHNSPELLSGEVDEIIYTWTHHNHDEIT